LSRLNTVAGDALRGYFRRDSINQGAKILGRLPRRAAVLKLEANAALRLVEDGSLEDASFDAVAD